MPVDWTLFFLLPRPGGNGVMYYTLLTKKALDPGSVMGRMGKYDPSLEQKTEGSIEVFFYDEKHTKTVMIKPRKYITQPWWEANGPPDVSWEEIKASPRIFSTTVGIMMGLLNASGPSSEVEVASKNLVLVPR